MDRNGNAGGCVAPVSHGSCNGEQAARLGPRIRPERCAWVYDFDNVEGGSRRNGSAELAGAVAVEYGECARAPSFVSRLSGDPHGGDAAGTRLRRLWCVATTHGNLHHDAVGVRDRVSTEFLEVDHRDAIDVEPCPQGRRSRWVWLIQRKVGQRSRT